MIVLADECVAGEVVARLRADGHAVEATGVTAAGAADDDVLARAAGSGRLLLTADKDFGELVYRLRRVHAGVVLLRLAGVPAGERAELLPAVFRESGSGVAGRLHGDRPRRRAGPPPTRGRRWCGHSSRHRGLTGLGQFAPHPGPGEADFSRWVAGGLHSVGRPPDGQERARQWFEWCVAQLESNSAQSPEGAVGPFRCPCCSCLTLDERGGYDICPVCFWEDDGPDDHDAAIVRGGPNGSLSLTQARANYREFGACDRSMVGNVRLPRAGEWHESGQAEPLT